MASSGNVNLLLCLVCIKNKSLTWYNLATIWQVEKFVLTGLSIVFLAKLLGISFVVFELGKEVTKCFFVVFSLWFCKNSIFREKYPFEEIFKT